MSIGVTTGSGIGANVRAGQQAQSARTRSDPQQSSNLPAFSRADTTPAPPAPYQPRVPPPNADPAFAEMLRQAEWQRRQQRSQLQFEQGLLGPTFERAMHQSRRQYDRGAQALDQSLGASNMAFSSTAGKLRERMRTDQMDKESEALGELMNNKLRLADQIANADRGEIAFGAESALQWARDYMAKQLGSLLGVA